MPKTVLVTGANSGIGKEIALEFATRGYKVYATDLVISKEVKTGFETSHGDLIVTDLLDVTKIEDILRVKNRIKEENDGKLDFLFCNAGIVINSHATDISDEALFKMYNVNLFGNIRLVREFIKLVVEAEGTIVFSGSVTKSLPMHSNALYSSTKAALAQYAYVLHAELKNYGVKVLHVVGGPIKTNIFPTSAVIIPDDSIYNFHEYKDIYKNRSEVVENISNQGMDPSIFAKRTIDQVEKSNINTFEIFEGYKSKTIHLASSWVSTKLLINKYLGMFGLNFNYRDHLKDESSI